VEFKMRSVFPIEFQQELDRFRNKRDPLHSFSLSFGRWLLSFPGHITKTGRVRTKNLRNRISENQEWLRQE
jgi:hypothetical protein